MERAEWIGQIMLSGWLGILSVQDTKQKAVDLKIVLGTGLTGLGYCVLACPHSCQSILAGVGIGIIFVAISAISRGKIGMGDGIVFICSGLFLGFFENLSLLIYAVFIAGITAVCLLVFCRKKRSDCFPFLPCVFFAQMIRLGFAILELTNK